MNKHFFTIAASLALGACGQATDDAATNQAAGSPAQPKKKVPYCFFKDAEMKSWAATRGKDGNIIVTGKAYRSDSRYQAVFSPPEVTGTTAEIRPTIQNNSTGYGAVDNWWDLKSTIPNSAAVETVTVRCGAKAVADLKVPARA